MYHISSTVINISGSLLYYYHHDVLSHISLCNVSNILFMCGMYANLRINLNPLNIQIHFSLGENIHLLCGVMEQHVIAHHVHVRSC